MTWNRYLLLGLVILPLSLGAIPVQELSQAEPGASDAIPEAFTPFSHMIGAWKGQTAPTADRLRGWIERHEWAWAFDKGRPVGMTLTFENSKLIDQARLTYSAESKRYRLEGKDPDGQPIAFEGTLDPETRVLTLDRDPPGPGGPERLTIRPNSNKIRYIVWLDRKPDRSPAYRRVSESNLGKEGVNFAGGAASAAEECIVTGGTATLTVSYQGKTYPLCCSGCREQFLANPERYLAKAAARGKNASAGNASPADDAFGGRKSESPAMKPQARPGTPSETPKAEPDDQPEEPKPTVDEARAASFLRLGQTLEKQGKKDLAIDYYRRILKEFDGSKAAPDARKRLEALGEKP